MEFNANLTIEEWTGNNDLSISIFNNKYKNGNETFMETIDRISGGNEEIKQLILEKKFLPGGRIMAGRGLSKNGRKVSLSNCYVLPPVEDNLESIFDSAKKMARTFSAGGGVGIQISNLAFRGAKVNNAAKTSSGAVSFMDLYSMVTEVIAQNGRRAALMISMDVTHPDIEEFITVKQDLNKVTKANISVQVTDEFMRAVKNDEDFELRFTRQETKETKTKTVKAKELFKKLAYGNYDYAEPGILFWDTINAWHLQSENKEFKFAGVNPCAEECLPDFGACLLGSINLSEFVKFPFSSFASFDFDEFRKTVDICVRELNNILEEGIPLHPLKEQSESATDWRQIGLGVMGISDALIKLGLKYGSEDSLKICDEIAFYLANQSIKTSAELSKELGKFPKYNEDALFNSDFFLRNTLLETRELVARYGMRNSQLLAIAPTGSLSNVLGVSGGIEPIFANSYTRKTQTLHESGDTNYKVYTPIVKEYMEKFGIEDEKDLPDYFVTAPEIPYEERIKMQAVWQKHIDSSISSTVNLPESATVEDIEDLYMKAWEHGLKGITVFRNNCKRVAILTVDEKREEKKEEITNSVESSDTNKNGAWATQVKELVEEAITPLKPIEAETIGPARGEVVKVRNENISGLKRKLITGCGSLHCEAFFDKTTGELVETFLSKGSTGGCNNFMVGLSRFISMAARLGASIYDIVDQLQSTGSCPSYAVRRAVHKDTSKGSCCPMAVGNALLDMYEEFNKIGNYAEKERDSTIDKEWLSKLLSTVEDEYKTMMPIDVEYQLSPEERKTIVSDFVSHLTDNESKPLPKLMSFKHKENECISVNLNKSPLTSEAVNDIFETVLKQNTEIKYTEEALCPQCNSKLDHEGGCDICRDCGWTRCD